MCSIYIVQPKLLAGCVRKFNFRQKLCSIGFYAQHYIFNSIFLFRNDSSLVIMLHTSPEISQYHRIVLGWKFRANTSTFVIVRISLGDIIRLEYNVTGKGALNMHAMVI